MGNATEARRGKGDGGNKMAETKWQKQQLMRNQGRVQLRAGSTHLAIMTGHLNVACNVLAAMQRPKCNGCTVTAVV